MGPQRSNECNVSSGWHARSHRFEQTNQIALRCKMSGSARQERENSQARQQDQQWSHELAWRKLGPPTRSRADRQGHAEQYADPPCGDDSPSNAQHRRVIRRKHRRMTDCEIFDANACGELVVDDAIYDSARDTHQDDDRKLQRMVYLKVPRTRRRRRVLSTQPAAWQVRCRCWRCEPVDSGSSFANRDPLATIRFGYDSYRTTV